MLFAKLQVRTVRGERYMEAEMMDMEIEREKGELIGAMGLSRGDGEALTRYLREIGKVEMLSHEEEARLAALAKAGDRRARARVIEANLRFVVSVAKRFAGQGLSLEDLIEEGNLGLCVAIDKFEPDKGYHFISYAVWWVRQSIMKALSEKGRSVRLPLNRANELVRIQRAQRELMHEEETTSVTEAMIAERTGLEEGLVRDLLAASGETVSFDAPARGGDEGDSTLGDFQESSDIGPEESLVSSSMREDLSSLLGVLTERERRVIELRYGLSGEEPLSLKEIGEMEDLTKERIRQIEKRALERLREEGLRRGMDEYSRAV